MGLVLQPYWSPGVRVPGPEAKGAVIGWGDVHTRAHLYRAIIEGLAYALREGAERTTKRTGVPITELRVSGGGSQSPAAIQLTADIFGLPTSRPHTHETSGLGAAIDAAVGLGLHPVVRGGGGRDDADRRDARAVADRPRRVRGPVPERLPAACTSGCGRCTQRSGGSPGTRRRPSCQTSAVRISPLPPLVSVSVLPIDRRTATSPWTTVVTACSSAAIPSSVHSFSGRGIGAEGDRRVSRLVATGARVAPRLHRDRARVEHEARRRARWECCSRPRSRPRCVTTQRVPSSG